MALFTAISIALVYAVRIPMFAPFLEYDPADITIFIATIAFGIPSGLMLTVAVSIIQGFTVSASSGIIGIVMHIVATGSFVVVCGLVNRRKNTTPHLIAALVAGSLTMTAVMVGMNLVLTPIFMGSSVETVVEMLVPIIIPFNLVKSTINAWGAFMIYSFIKKPLERYDVSKIHS